MSRLIALFQHLTQYIRPLAAALGAPGVALVSFLDSSVLPLPEVVDLLVVASVVEHPSLWLVYGLAATGGSVAGCYALYMVARMGGEAFVRRRLHERHVERGLRLFRRHGMFALVVPSLMPPPTPFKLFILVAGLAEVRSHTFILALTIGRGFRFVAIAWLAYEYGNKAAAFMRTTLPLVSAWAAFAIVVAAVIAFFWRRRRAA